MEIIKGNEPMEMDSKYKKETDAAIRTLISDFECQPILFVGSGLSRRYFDAPDWGDLIKRIFLFLPNGSDKFEYNLQKYDGNYIKIGSILSDLIFEWAWNAGRSEFPEEFFTGKLEKSAFMKYLSCDILKNMTPNIEDIDSQFAEEIESLRQIRPHAIITTNYDLLVDQIFEGYQGVVGQTILKYNTNSFGEIFHIHGSVDEFASIVLTEKDYLDWSDKKKYVSAKLLTYFAEHPVFIIGYGLGDPNIKELLRDIGFMVADENGLIPNVYQIIWNPTPIPAPYPDQAIFSFENKEYRTRAIYTNDWKWIFDALKSQSALTSVNPKLVRALAARMMKLIRHDIPSGSVVVNYDVLERITDEDEALPKLLGISVVSNTNQSHPLTLGQVAQKIGFNHWTGADKLIRKIKEETGINIRSTDNKYHERIKTGHKSFTRKWSLEFVDLLECVKNGDEYKLSL